MGFLLSLSTGVLDMLPPTSLASGVAMVSSCWKSILMNIDCAKRNMRLVSLGEHNFCQIHDKVLSRRHHERE